MAEEAETAPTPAAEVEIFPVSLSSKAAALKQSIGPASGFQLSLGAKTLGAETDIIFKKRNIFPEELTLPDNKVALSPLWEFDLTNKKAYNRRQPLRLQLTYEASLAAKGIFFWNGKTWQALPSQIVDSTKRLIEAPIYLPYAKVIVLGDAKIMGEGQASWYNYKKCDCAASPDYPKGTKLKVTNIANGKSVVVKVNDFGPERDIFPARAIDLDVVAFKKIANKRAGVIEVLVEPVAKH
ncbi:MAG: septal ring lytic transglycosylase RlpA family protein [Patescibacteria group bacterium]